MISQDAKRLARYARLVAHSPHAHIKHNAFLAGDGIVRMAAIGHSHGEVPEEGVIDAARTLVMAAYEHAPLRETLYLAACLYTTVQHIAGVDALASPDPHPRLTRRTKAPAPRLTGYRAA